MGATWSNELVYVLLWCIVPLEFNLGFVALIDKLVNQSEILFTSILSEKISDVDFGLDWSYLAFP